MKNTTPRPHAEEFLNLYIQEYRTAADLVRREQLRMYICGYYFALYDYNVISADEYRRRMDDLEQG